MRSWAVMALSTLARNANPGIRLFCLWEKVTDGRFVRSATLTNLHITSRVLTLASRSFRANRSAWPSLFCLGNSCNIDDTAKFASFDFPNALQDFRANISLFLSHFRPRSLYAIVISICFPAETCWRGSSRRPSGRICDPKSKVVPRRRAAGRGRGA